MFSLFRWRSVVWCFGDTLRTAGPINHLGVIGIGISELFFLKNKIVSLQIWSSLRCLFTWGSALPPAFFGMILQSVSPYKSNVSLHNCQEYLMGHGGRYTTNAWTNQW